MHVWPDGIEFLALLLEAAGVLLLFREVWRGHEAEGHASTFAQLERIEQPMRRGDWQEAWAENYIYRQPTAKRIREASAFATAAGPVESRRAIENEWQDELGDRFRTSQQKWLYWAEPANLERRKRLLWLGSGLILAALLLQGALLGAPEHDVAPIDDSGPDDGGDRSVFAPDWSAVLIADATRIRFDPAEASLTYTHDGQTVDLTSTVCEAKRSLAASGVGSVLVVGRFDHRELSTSARLRWSSNQALAQARADSVANYLEESNECAPGLGTVVRTIGGPKYPGRAISAQQLSADRSVEVFGLVTRSVKRASKGQERPR
jgi:hypothetical protein